MIQRPARYETARTNYAEQLDRLHDPEFLPTLEQVKEIARNVDDVAWFSNMFHGETSIFEIYTQEYVQALSNYIIERTQALEGDDEPITVLEVGAGNGRLTSLLQEFTTARLGEEHNINFIATDSMSWNLPQHAPVEQLDYKAALNQYRPQIVICSWMPCGEDWTKDFRETPETDEYILIGPPDEVTGDPWHTWGYEYAQNHQQDSRENTPKLLSRIKSWLNRKKEAQELRIKPYAADGFSMTNLAEMHQLQACRLDKFSTYGQSRTFSFRRKGQTPHPQIA